MRVLSREVYNLYGHRGLIDLLSVFLRIKARAKKDLIMIKLILAYASISPPLEAHQVDIHDWALKTYGTEISFDIKRNGNNIGTHQVKFTKSENQLLVEANTQIRVKFLFFTAFKFDYNSKELWQNGELKSLSSFTNNDGKKSNVSLEYGDDIVNVTNEKGSFTNILKEPVFTTNHWNPNVLGEKMVLNTLTGKINNIEINKLGFEMVPAGNGTRKAMRHSYDGDLNNISTWYDEKSRWVGLNFKGRDGSLISYECNQCGIE
jgi:hypothetical protein